jgi:hypothetical protein
VQLPDLSGLFAKPSFNLTLPTISMPNIDLVRYYNVMLSSSAPFAMIIVQWMPVSCQRCLFQTNHTGCFSMFIVDCDWLQHHLAARSC